MDSKTHITLIRDALHDNWKSANPKVVPKKSCRRASILYPEYYKTYNAKPNNPRHRLRQASAKTSGDGVVSIRTSVIVSSTPDPKAVIVTYKNQLLARESHAFPLQASLQKALQKAA